MIRCGHKVHQASIGPHYHDSVAQVRLCYSREFGIKSDVEQEYDAHAEMEAAWEYEQEQAAEIAYMRYLEDRSYALAARDEAMYGVDPF